MTKKEVFIVERKPNVTLSKEWLDGTGYDPQRDPQWVREHGGSKQYPGCGISGRCMPCGEKLITLKNGDLICKTYRQQGCPSVLNPMHDFSLGKDRHICKKCGGVLGWFSRVSGKWFKTLRLALIAGESGEDLVRPSRERKS